MLPFGELRQFRGTRPQVLSRWMTVLEQAGCEVIRENEGRLNVLVPGWESTVVLQRWFWDRMIVSVSEDGAVRFRLVYFSVSQLLLHLAITAIFAFEVWFGGPSLPRDPAQFAAAFVVAQCVPILVTLAGFRFAREAALRMAME